MSSTSKKVTQAGLVLSALAIIGFIGVVWLMIYGNLSGNLGFQRDSNVTALQELTLGNSSIVTFADTIDKSNPSVSNVVVINATGGETLTSGNYTLTATTITGSSTSEYNDTAVNTSYTTSFDSQGGQAAEGVISNITGGFATFFGFSNTFFTIAAIILLIFMLLGLLALVMTIARGSKNKKSDF